MPTSLHQGLSLGSVQTKFKNRSILGLERAIIESFTAYSNWKKGYNYKYSEVSDNVHHLKIF